MNKLHSLLLVLIFIWQTGCVLQENDQKKITDFKLDYSSSMFKRIHSWQDEQSTDSLYVILRHPNPAYRYLSALAFASIRDSVALDSLVPLLQDDFEEVRTATAYAIGQLGAVAGQKYLIDAFDRNDTAGVHAQSNRAILEAVGKCGTIDYLKSLSTITTYLYPDTALLEGQTLGIYRFALRNLTLPEGTQRMLQLATDGGYPVSVRLIAAHYLQRASDIKLDSLAGTQLIPAFNQEENPGIRMALAIALGKTGTITALSALTTRFGQEPDYRVKCNILRAISNFSYSKSKALAYKGLRDPDINVATRAAQFFIEKGIAEEASTYWQLAKDSTFAWPVQIGLYQATVKYIPKNFLDIVNGEFRQRFLKAAGPYQRALALKALAELGWNYRFIQREGFAAKTYVVKTASVEALAAISDRSDFVQYFGLNTRGVTRDLAHHFKNAIRSGDAGMIAVAATALRNPDRNYPSVFRDTIGFMEEALAGLDLPKEIETYNELKHTIEYFKGNKNFQPLRPEFNHPINWSLLGNLQSQPIAVITTKKGTIEIQLMPREAPGTVANFIQLANDGFFNGKVFHRVVPNFVIQGGCPRGDGYGSLDYTIRSELPPLYYHEDGMVGMASAGNHTEGTQFFITHSPTPHLDGNYTIFGKVIKGMDVVHKIQPGDLMDSVKIK